jgi:hypothetical protein
MHLKQVILGKAVTILDMVAWIAQNPELATQKTKIRTQVISTENTYQERDLKQLEMLN